jgi:conjugal transfer/entry exclusion protein
MIKKVPTNQVIVTPTTQSSVKLDEMNKIIREMEQGGEALKRLQEIDASAGFVDPAQKRKAEAEYKRREERKSQDTAVPYVPPLQSADGALDDKTLAANMLAQAKRMEIEAKGMIAEAARMKKDAERLQPNVAHDKDHPSTTAPTTSPKRGRPAKTKAVADAAQ